MTSVERNKSKHFNSRGKVQRFSPPYRNCENSCRIVMILGTLVAKKVLIPRPKLAQKKEKN
jgi:hypothetical protein